MPENVMATDQIVGLSPQEYLVFERKALTKHEYVDGELREMVAASRPHILIVGNIAYAIQSQTRGRLFEVYQSDMRVRVPSGPYYYPDVTVAPSPPELEDEESDTLLNPLVVVEVLSPSTRRVDRGEKLDNYRRIPSLTDYLIVAQDRVWVDRYLRDGAEWRLEDFSNLEDRLRFETFSCELSLADVYERVFSAE
jgi:Uma2 family endonuclease